MDSNDDNEVDNDYIHYDDKGFEFYNAAIDEWIDSLQVDFSIGQT